MVFSSVIFLFVFLPVTLIGYYLMSAKGRNIWLLVVSLFFFCWAQFNYLWLILFSIGINYAGAILIDNLSDKVVRRACLVISIIANLGLLFYFKYFNFTIDAINRIGNVSIPEKEIALPIGISFFTFQGLSYVIDVYKHKAHAQKNILKVALYIALFPQLIAGPIVRYVDIAKEIDYRTVSISDFSEGAKRFVLGFSKKILIANTMGAMVDSIWNAGVDQNTVAIAWVGAIAYMLQIYFDFSGYSDMAIGLGRMFGFHFLENFNIPYTSSSISEFWRRWHISLSSWFKDYVYIPLGGNRKHVYLNLAIVFILTGVWHGASWHYIVWGVERLFHFDRTVYKVA